MSCAVHPYLLLVGPESQPFRSERGRARRARAWDRSSFVYRCGSQFAYHFSVINIWTAHRSAGHFCRSGFKSTTTMQAMLKLHAVDWANRGWLHRCRVTSWEASPARMHPGPIRDKSPTPPRLSSHVLVALGFTGRIQRRA